jgi:heparan-alpha-glucosaminide N-acetyltransferase
MTDPGSTPLPRQARVQSLDLLRGLDVLLMLFVNDIAGVTGTPAFLRHVSRSTDGMTITDVVFPAFLFITGMSIPLAIDRRLQKGESRAAVWRHVLIRALSLVVIGTFMVNGESAEPGGLLSPAAWTALMAIGVGLIWTAELAPAGATTTTTVHAATETRRRTVRWIAGALILLFLAAVYYDGGAHGSGFSAFRPRWWGILGLIGWAYLAAVTIYLFSARTPFALLGAAALVYVLTLADQAGHAWWLAALHLPSLPLGMVLGVHTAVVLSGIVLTLIFVRARMAGAAPSSAIAPALGYAVGLGLAAVLVHQLNGFHTAFWYNKIIATVPWGLMSSAWTAAVWALLYAVADVGGWRHWPRVVSIAGEHALTVYILAPLVLALFDLSAAAIGMNWYGALGQVTAIGFLRAIAFAVLTVGLCGWLASRGVRLRL